LLDKPIEKRLLRTVTPETNRSLADILASQQLQHNRVLAMRRLPSLSDASQYELSANLVFGAKFEKGCLLAYETASDSRAGIGLYFNLYNQRRPHSSLALSRQCWGAWALNC